MSSKSEELKERRIGYNNRDCRIRSDRHQIRINLNRYAEEDDQD